MKKNNSFICVNPGQEDAIINGVKLLNEEVTGLLIENFFSEAECQNMAKTFMQIANGEKTVGNDGF